MLFLSNDDVQRVLTVEGAIRVLEEGHRELARQDLVARPRVDIYTETSNPEEFHRWGTMEGSSKGLHRHAIRMKSDIISWRDIGEGQRVEDKYCTQPGLYCGLIFLFDTNTGEPLALINDGYLQHMRVGALAALGVKYLAKENASVVGMLGSGGMAHSHLEAFAAVRPLKRVQVYSPTREHREAYAREMSEKLDIEVVPCESPDDAARGADILSTCTSSMTSTVFARMLEPGMHLTQVTGEFNADVIPEIDVSVGGDPQSQVVQGVPLDDTRGFTTYLSGSREALERAMGPGRRRDDLASGHKPVQQTKARIVPMVDLIAGTAAGRKNNREISSSSGVAEGAGKQGLQFVTVSSLVYDAAKSAGLGRDLPTEWFLQDIRN